VRRIADARHDALAVIEAERESIERVALLHASDLDQETLDPRVANGRAFDLDDVSEHWPAVGRAWEGARGRAGL